MASDGHTRSVVAMEPHSRSPFGLVLTVIAVAVAVVIGLTFFFWVLGLIAGLLGWVFRIAILAGVAAVVWHYVTRRVSRTRL